MDSNEAPKRSSFFVSKESLTQRIEVESPCVKIQIEDMKTSQNLMSSTEVDFQSHNRKSCDKSQNSPIAFKHSRSRSDYSKPPETPALISTRSSLRKIASGISDFHDSKQITNSINRLHSANDRIKLLDHVIQRRQELKDLEEKMRLEAAIPMIIKFKNNLRKKTIMKFTSINGEPKEGAQEVGLLKQGLTYNLDSVLMKMGLPSDYKGSNSAEESNMSSCIVSGANTPYRDLNQIQTPVIATEKDSKLFSRGNFAIAAFANFAKKAPHSSEFNPTSPKDLDSSLLNKVGEEEKQLLETKVRQFSKIFKAKILGSNNKHLDSKEYSQLIEQKTARKPVRQWTPRLDNFVLAKKDLKKDIYKFIVKSGTDSCRDLILKSVGSQQRNFNFVEEEVEKKLISRDQKNKLKNMLAGVMTSQSSGARKSFSHSTNSKLGSTTTTISKTQQNSQFINSVQSPLLFQRNYSIGANFYFKEGVSRPATVGTTNLTTRQ